MSYYTSKPFQFEYHKTGNVGELSGRDWAEQQRKQREEQEKRKQQMQQLMQQMQMRRAWQQSQNQRVNQGMGGENSMANWQPQGLDMGNSLADSYNQSRWGGSNYYQPQSSSSGDWGGWGDDNGGDWGGGYDYGDYGYGDKQGYDTDWEQY